MVVNLWNEDSEHYERFQPQGRRYVRTREQDGGRDHRTAGEGSCRVHQIPQRRSSTGGPAALDQGHPHGCGKAARIGELHRTAFADPQVKVPLLLVALVLLLSGCGHKQVTVAVPPAPPIGQQPSTESGATKPLETQEAIEIATDTKPLLVETGIASWYGAPYHNRRGSNGEIYDMHAMTAAHRTLPLGSIVRVTDPENGKSALVRITDRGPFIEGRILDLSRAAADQIGIVQKGTAMVRIEVLKTPEPIEAGGKWAVQIGGFGHEENARDLAGHLSRRYHTARVLTFSSPA